MERYSTRKVAEPVLAMAGNEAIFTPVAMDKRSKSAVGEPESERESVLAMAEKDSNSNDAPESTEKDTKSDPLLEKESVLSTQKAPKPNEPPLRVSLAEMYALPIPVRTFPLPQFFPNNPLSWLHIAWVVLRQTILCPSAEPAVVHIGFFDFGIGSVHVKDPKSMRALWEQGFFGKGNLSRSEPNWFKRKQIELGLAQGKVSELVTEERRRERNLAKWKRAVAEEEALEKIRQQEKLEDEETAKKAQQQAAEPHASHSASSSIEANTAGLSHAVSHTKWKFRPPVGPLELLALPNSASDLVSASGVVAPLVSAPGVVGSLNSTSPSTSPTPDIARSDSRHVEPRPNVRPLELLALPNSAADLDRPISTTESDVGPITTEQRPGVGPVTTTEQRPDVEPITTTTSQKQLELTTAPTESRYAAVDPAPDHADHPAPALLPETPRGLPRVSTITGDGLHSPKGVRFSPLIESTTFDRAAPPSPHRSPRVITTLPFVGDNLAISPLPDQKSDKDALVDKEHLQLCLEEAFFLAFGLGALSVIDPTTNEPMSNELLFIRCAQYSHFPALPMASLTPHTNFFVQYAVYHHYRSLGWVPRAGIKFGVDWLLYHRGPVFDHAEFGVIVLPAFTDPWWSANEAGQSRPPRTWAWLHGVLRVLSRVMKTFVITYVDVPPPHRFEAAVDSGGAAAVMALYKVKEVTIRRWSANRNRKAKPVK